ncbi:hypothetical protein, partial [Shigella boydii]|uniref:hypothetical protein n=1 Tax=Shigella boydii TaxID=621 RepID=UPI000B02E121
MPEIQCLSIFPAILTLSRSTDINVHLPTYVGTDDGISGFAPIFPDICYHLTHYKPAAADIPVASDNP